MSSLKSSIEAFLAKSRSVSTPTFAPKRKEKDDLEDWVKELREERERRRREEEERRKEEKLQKYVEDAIAKRMRGREEDDYDFAPPKKMRVESERGSYEKKMSAMEAELREWRRLASRGQPAYYDQAPDAQEEVAEQEPEEQRSEPRLKPKINTSSFGAGKGGEGGKESILKQMKKR